MRKILIASHSELAEGMKQTLKFFAGNQIDVSAICAYVDEESLQSKLDAFFEKVSDEDEVLIFTDLLGGSVNQAIIFKPQSCACNHWRIFKYNFRVNF